MKPTSDDFEPRRDGWYEHNGTWGEVTVGTVIADVQFRSKRWEIIEQAHGQQVQYGYTLWMRAREMSTGEEFTVKPRVKVSKLVILSQDPADTTTPERTPPSDSDAILLLVEKLGATHLASRDDKTGEIVCPDYTYDSHLPDKISPIRLGLIEHMRHAHDIAAPDNMALLEAINTHARGHLLESGTGKGGFPHRHVPEDSYLITGKASTS